MKSNNKGPTRLLVLLVFVGGQVFLCVAGCQVPDSAAPASHSVLDPCAERLHEIAGRLLLYYSVNKRLPASSDELNSMAGDGSALPLICPASGEAYLYRSQGLSVPGQPGKLVLYDATAAHHDGRWGIVVSDNAPGSSLITRVVWIDEAVMRSVPGAAEPLEKADTEKLD